jgi:hypothetical protein
MCCSCQPTPEEIVVINKGDGAVEEKIQSTPVPSAQIINTNRWQESYEITDLTCEIDTKIILPETNIFPIYKIKRSSFNENIVDRIIDYFCANATGVRETSATKEELLQQLIQVRRGTYMLDDDGGRWVPYEGQEEDIAHLEDQIEKATPESFSPIGDESTELPVDNTYLLQDGTKTYLNASEDHINIFKKKFGIIQLESWLADGEAIPGEPPNTKIDDVKISEEDAIKIVDVLISDLKIQNLGLAEVEKARIVDDYTSEIISKGWQLTYCRNDSDSIAVNLGSVQGRGVLSFDTEDFVERWNPESISVYIDEDGIQQFLWKYPLEITEILNENISLLPFDDIKERIKKQIKYGFSHTLEKEQISNQFYLSIDKVVLSNVLIPIKDDLSFQMLSPAWLIYYKSYSYIQGDKYEDPLAVFAVNAIDGSSIDLSMRRKDFY